MKLKTYYKLTIECKTPDISDMSEAQRKKLQELNLRYLGRHINDTFPTQFSMKIKVIDEEL